MGKPVMSGWLTKEGGRVKNWKRRYFTLDSRHMLRYYKSETDKKEAGHIDMTQCQKIICANRCRCEWHHTVDEKLAFGIVTPKRTFHIYGDRMDELQQWMLAFKKAARITAAIPVGNPIVEGTTKNALRQRAEAHEDRARRISMNLSSQLHPMPEHHQTPMRNTVSVVPAAPAASSVRRQPPLHETAHDEERSDEDEEEGTKAEHWQQQQRTQQQVLASANGPSRSSSSSNSSSHSPQRTASERQQTRAKFLDVFNLKEEAGEAGTSLRTDTDITHQTPPSHTEHDSRQAQSAEEMGNRWGEREEGEYDNFDYVGRVEEDHGSGSEDGGDADADEDRLAFIDAMKKAAQDAEQHGAPHSQHSGSGGGGDGISELSEQTGALRLQSTAAPTNPQTVSAGGYESSDFFSSDDEDDDGTAC